MAYELNIVGLSIPDTLERVRQIPAEETSLKLSEQDNQLGLGCAPEQLLAVIDALKDSHIQSLDVSGHDLNQLSVAHVDAFFVALKNTAIHTLILKRNNLGIKCNGDLILPHMLEHIQSSSIRSLDLGRNYLLEGESDTNTQIIEAIGKCRLDTLGLSGNDLGYLEIDTLLRMGAAISQAKVQKLDVSSNGLFALEAGIQDFIAGFRDSKLMSLDLTDNELDVNGKEMLSTIFSAFPLTPIREIDLTGNCGCTGEEELVEPFDQLAGSAPRISRITVDGDVARLAEKTVLDSNRLEGLCIRVLRNAGFFGSSEVAAPSVQPVAAPSI